MRFYLNVSQIVLAVALIAVVLFQVRGGGLGGIFGQPGTVYRTRRGVEKLLFQLTIVLVVAFLVISVLTLRFSP
jgi:preprotein translocase subunit SecG